MPGITVPGSLLVKAEDGEVLFSFDHLFGHGVSVKDRLFICEPGGDPVEYKVKAVHWYIDIANLSQEGVPDVSGTRNQLQVIVSEV